MTRGRTDVRHGVANPGVHLRKETKNAVRYQEQHAVDQEPKITTLYIRKAAASTPGRWSPEQPYPLDIRVTIEGADEDE